MAPRLDFAEQRTLGIGLVQRAAQRRRELVEVVHDALLLGLLGTAIQGRSLRQIAWLRLKRDKVALAGGGVIVA